MFVQSHIQRAHRHNHNHSNHYNQPRPQSTAGAAATSPRTAPVASSHSAEPNHSIKRPKAVELNCDRVRRQNDDLASCRPTIEHQRPSQQVARPPNSGTSPDQRKQTGEPNQSSGGRGVALACNSGDDQQTSRNQLEVQHEAAEVTSCQLERGQRPPLGLRRRTRAIEAIAGPRLSESEPPPSDRQISGLPATGPALAHSASAQSIPMRTKLDEPTRKIRDRAPESERNRSLSNGTLKNRPQSNIALKRLSSRRLRARGRKVSAASRRANSTSMRCNSSDELNFRRLIEQTGQFARAKPAGVGTETEPRSKLSFIEAAETFAGRPASESVRGHLLWLLDSYIKRLSHLFVLFMNHFLAAQWETLRSLFMGAPNVAGDGGGSEICIGPMPGSDRQLARRGLKPADTRNVPAEAHCRPRPHGRATCRAPEGPEYWPMQPLDGVRLSHQKAPTDHCNSNRPSPGRKSRSFKPPVCMACCRLHGHFNGRPHVSSESASQHNTDIDYHQRLFHQHQQRSFQTNEFDGSRTRGFVSRSFPTKPHLFSCENTAVLLPPSYHETLAQHSVCLSDASDWNDCRDCNWPPVGHCAGTACRDQRARVLEDELNSPPDGAVSYSSSVLLEGGHFQDDCVEWQQSSRPVTATTNNLTARTQLAGRQEFQLKSRARDERTGAQSQFTRAKSIAPAFPLGRPLPAPNQIAPVDQLRAPSARKLSSVMGSDSELCRRRSQTVGLISSSASSSMSSDANHLTRLAPPSARSTGAKRRPDLPSDFCECPPRSSAPPPSSGRSLLRQTSSASNETSSSRRADSSSGAHQTSGPPTRTAEPALARSEARAATSVARAWTSLRLTSSSKANSVRGVSDDSAELGPPRANLSVSGKSMSHPQSPIATTLGKVSLAGARRRLGFKQTRGLNSLSVHRSEEIFPCDLGAGLPARHFASTTTTSTPGSYSLNDSCDLDQQQQAAQSKWLGQLSSEPPDPRVCFVDGLGLGQIVSRQALVSPQLGAIQLGLSTRRGMLEVEVIRVRRLRPKAGAMRLPTVYVKVYLMRHKKCLAKFKTSATSNTLDPLFQQLFIFRDDHSKCVLQLIVWADYGKHDRKSLMGVVQIHLDDLDISKALVGWYKLLDAPSVAGGQSVASSSKSLRQTLSTAKLADLSGPQRSI